MMYTFDTYTDGIVSHQHHLKGKNDTIMKFIKIKMLVTYNIFGYNIIPAWVLSGSKESKINCNEHPVTEINFREQHYDL